MNPFESNFTSENIQIGDLQKVVVILQQFAIELLVINEVWADDRKLKINFVRPKTVMIMPVSGFTIFF